MKKWLLSLVSPADLMRFVPVNRLIDAVVDWLASTVKNPNSIEAQNVIGAVTRLEDACTRFLDKVVIR